MSIAMTQRSAQKSWWSKYRLPIILSVIALSVYAFSIVWFVYIRGPLS